MSHYDLPTRSATRHTPVELSFTFEDHCAAKHFRLCADDEVFARIPTSEESFEPLHFVLSKICLQANAYTTMEQQHAALVRANGEMRDALYHIHDIAYEECREGNDKGSFSAIEVIARKPFGLPADDGFLESASTTQESVAALKRSLERGAADFHKMKKSLLAKTAQWFPIETAPRDGRYVIVAGDSGYHGAPLRCEVCRYDAEYRPLSPWVDHANDSFEDGGPAPLYWMPLPPPPQET